MYADNIMRHAEERNNKCVLIGGMVDGEFHSLDMLMISPFIQHMIKQCNSAFT